MGIENLKEKSEENYKTGEWAEKRGYYDVAVSRFYYCIYQKIIYISKKNGFYNEELSYKKDSHMETVNNFVSSLNNMIPSEDKISIMKIKNLRRLRNRSDYNETKIGNKDFTLKFKYDFNEINSIINKLI